MKEVISRNRIARGTSFFKFFTAEHWQLRAGHVNVARYCTTVLHAKHASRILFFLNLWYSLYLTQTFTVCFCQWGVWGDVWTSFPFLETMSNQ